MAHVGGLASALDELATEDLRDVPNVALAADLVELQRAAARLAFEFTRRLAVFDARGACADDGALSTGAWLRHFCRIAPGAAHQHVKVAHQLDALPRLAAALAGGDVTYPHAAVISAFAEQVGPEATAAGGGVPRRRRPDYDPARLRHVTRRLRHAVDPDGALADAGQMVDRRRLRVVPTLWGMVDVDGALDPEAGATVLAALHPLAAPTPDDTRPASQRMADALVELCRRALDAGDLPIQGGMKPHLLVTVDLPTLQHAPGSPSIPSAPAGPGAELEWAGPIPAETARRIACDAALTRVLTNGPSQILDVGRATRIIPAALRKALLLRDGTCRFPGCDRPGRWTDAHHRTHWVDGGPTDLQNLLLLCTPHHMAVHEGGWTLHGHPDGSITATRGTRTITAPPPPHWQHPPGDRDHLSAEHHPANSGR